MTSARAKYHSLETRAEALRLRAEGMKPKQISERLNVSTGALHYWFHHGAKLPDDAPRPVRVKPSGKSGVIAPRPYRTGYVYGAGW
jgi:orotate phosphoribosyltransferase-like protein